MSDYIKEKVEEFREKFIYMGEYPGDGSDMLCIRNRPEDIEAFLTQSLQEMEERIREEERRVLKFRIEMLMDKHQAEMLQQRLETFYPNGGACPICGTNPLKQRKMILDLLSHKKESGEKEPQKEGKE